MSQHIAITLGLVLMILARSLDQTMYYRLSFNYGIYSWFLATFVLPLGILIVSWPVVWYKMSRTGPSAPSARPGSPAALLRKLGSDPASPRNGTPGQPRRVRATQTRSPRR